VNPHQVNGYFQLTVVHPNGPE